MNGQINKKERETNNIEKKCMVLVLSDVCCVLCDIVYCAILESAAVLNDKYVFIRRDIKKKKIIYLFVLFYF